MMNGGKIVFDVRGEERSKMTVDDLLERFRQSAGEELDNDRILLSKVEKTVNEQPPEGRHTEKYPGEPEQQVPGPPGCLFCRDYFTYSMVYSKPYSSWSFLTAGSQSSMKVGA